MHSRFIKVLLSVMLFLAAFGGFGQTNTNSGTSMAVPKIPSRWILGSGAWKVGMVERGELWTLDGKYLSSQPWFPGWQVPAGFKGRVYTLIILGPITFKIPCSRYVVAVCLIAIFVIRVLWWARRHYRKESGDSGR